MNTTQTENKGLAGSLLEDAITQFDSLDKLRSLKHWATATKVSPLHSNNCPMIWA